MPEQNWEGETLKTPTIKIKKYITPFRVVLAIAVISVSALVWQFGWKQLELASYRKGFTAGQNEINNAVLNQLLQTGKIQMNIPLDENGQFNQNGQVKQIFLAPI